MASPCTEDTQSVTLNEDDDGNLIADVRLAPVASSSLGVGATGLFVDLASSPGLQHTATGLQVDVQGNGMQLNANGLQATHATTRTGWAIGANDIRSENFAVNRGASTVVGAGLSLALTNTGTIATIFLVQTNWEGVWQTPFPSLGDPGTALDSIQVNLQHNTGAGWFNSDWATITGSNQAGSFHLRMDWPMSIAASASVTVQTRLLATGSTLTGTAIQGRINNSYRRYIQATW